MIDLRMLLVACACTNARHIHAEIHASSARRHAMLGSWVYSSRSFLLPTPLFGVHCMHLYSCADPVNASYIEGNEMMDRIGEVVA